mmetsp:Transcript_27206/g.63345  ORF Transcript_27206/g.63345 Transcript_27206/m.63345 type:complete len:706 (-) Transcript_27206:58-2175(-)
MKCPPKPRAQTPEANSHGTGGQQDVVAKNLRIMARTHSQNLECLTGKPRTIARAALNAVGHDNDSAYQLLMSDMAVTVIDGSTCSMEKLEVDCKIWTDSPGTVQAVGAFAGCTLLQVSRHRTEPLELFALEPVDVCVLSKSKQPIDRGWMELEYTDVPEMEGVEPADLGELTVQTRHFDPGSVRIPLDSAIFPILRISCKEEVAAPRNTVRLRKRHHAEQEADPAEDSGKDATAVIVPLEEGDITAGGSLPSKSPACAWPGKRFKPMETLGSGSFGTVVLAADSDGKHVAIKHVMSISGMKSREVELLRKIRHPFVVQLICAYEEDLSEAKQRELCIVMEYLPQNLHQRINGKPLEVRMVRVLAFQLLRTLLHLHGMSICHRDVKPENIMLADLTLKLVDFGSAKLLHGEGPSHHYICSRWWRAPELVLGSNFYTTRVDWWSAGCVIAEMMLGQPLFPGNSSWGQMYSIIRALGTPTAEEVHELNPKQPSRLSEHLAKLAKVGRKAEPWQDLLPAFAKHPEALEIPKGIVQYSPSAREHLGKMLCRSFFGDLVADTGPLPASLFDFTDIELSACEPAEKEKLAGLAEAHRQAATVAVPEDAEVAAEGQAAAVSTESPQSAQEVTTSAVRKGWVRKPRNSARVRQAPPQSGDEVCISGVKRTAAVAVDDVSSDAEPACKRRKELHVSHPVSPRNVPSREENESDDL